jgi:hypothetical protein
MGRVNHVSDEGYPTFSDSVPPEYLFVVYNMVEMPEQLKYTVDLTIYYSDPNQAQEIYTYLPSLRRSLRRSSTARCAPVIGTDFVIDDLNTRPVRLADFSYRVLGKKKVLLQMHMNPVRCRDRRFYNDTSLPGWPKSGIGPWELRNVWVVEETPLPSKKDYCYGTRVTYVDTDVFNSFDTDLYDPGQTLWKVFNVGVATGPLGDSHGSIVPYVSARGLVVDLQGSHASLTHAVGTTLFNSQAPEKYRDPHSSALQQIGR